MRRSKTAGRSDYASLAPTLIMPTLACLLCVGISALTVLLLSCFGVLISPLCLRLITGAVVLACTVTFVLLCRMYRPLQQLDAILARIVRESSGDKKNPAAPTIKGRMGMASENAELLLERYVAAINKEYASELLTRQAQFTVLQNQIHPHFLYNTLESIRGQALCEGVPEIADMAETLSHFFRYSISQMGDFVTVKQELDNVGDYFRIQKYRFGDKLNLVLLRDDDDPLERFYMPKLTLQPVVENSIIHGFEEKLEPGTITIRVVLTGKSVHIHVKDDGLGMDAATLDELRRSIGQDADPTLKPDSGNSDPLIHKSVALRNVNQRIRMFYGSGYGLYITSMTMIGTEVEIVLPAVTEPPSLNGVGGVV